ncbi:hypothetical protein SAMN02745975_00368 [Geosporobacter subterraneus DSM 17957]|uniref:DUF3805 domain-containing protein n=1 Tax=Geosporobacter subterraneus DSM 17957 TaxID=1121919 RepID=A0A1M6D456_9FIRM|nr:hypothetical protein [Geosporobacter subterraneus]SHI67874.1 hypothetical protein SAMN02745975_00368 [Geosporobacter subterraneus DSM 17957]
MKKIKAALWILLSMVLITGCAAPKDYFVYTSVDKEWSMQIPKTYEKNMEENDETLKIYMKAFKNNKGTVLNIMEMPDEGVKIASEKYIQEELAAIDDYLHIERLETINLEKIGKIYGALVEDHATNSYMFLYKWNHSNKLISVMVYQMRPFTLEEEAQIKNLISTIKPK